MNSPFNEALEDGLKRLGKTATPDELRRRGVRRIRSISTRQISKLIEQSVSKTLLERTFRVSEEERQELVTRANRRVRKLLEVQRDIDRRREQVAEARAELDKYLTESETKSVPGTGPDRADVHSIFSRMNRGQIDVHSAEDAVLRLVRQSSLAPNSSSGEVPEILRRRIEKLLRFLDETDHALANASAHLGGGITSEDHSVQGLALDDPDRERKSVMLRGLFKDNQDLK